MNEIQDLLEILLKVDIVSVKNFRRNSIFLSVRSVSFFGN